MIRISKDFYDIPNRSNIKQCLIGIYNNKCAYCEKSGINQDLEVEHYRPKGESITPGEQHDGYSWLENEWSNLLLSCRYCNSKKSSKFPLGNGGIRVNIAQENQQEWRADSISFLNEQALLLNPEIDRPEEHVEFLIDGIIKGKTERGRITINICGLDHEKNNLNRKKIQDDFIFEIARLLKLYLSLKSKHPGKINDISHHRICDYLHDFACDSLHNLKEKTLPNKEYSAYCSFLFNSLPKDLIDKIISTLVETPKQKIDESTKKYLRDILNDLYHKNIL